VIIYTAKKKTSKSWRPTELNWEQFVDRLRKPLRTGETMREYRAMEKPDKDIRKEMAGGFVAGELKSGRRKTENVINRCMVTLDADHARPGTWDRITPLLEFTMACYSTHSHTPDKPRLRWIVPTDRVMTPDEYPAVARRVAEWIDMDSFDPTTYEVARLMYWPTAAQDGVYEFHEQVGDVLSVDDVLATYGPRDAWKDSTLWPIGKEEQEIRVRELKHLGDPCDKPGIIGLFCRTYDVPSAIDEFLPDVYEDAGPDRYTYTKGSTAGGARVYNNGAYLYSSHATDPAGGQSCNSFDLVRIHKFGHLDDVSGEDTPVTKLPSYSAMEDWANSLPAIKKQRDAERRADMQATFGDLNSVKTAADDEIDRPNDEDATDDMAWVAKLDTNKKTGDPEPNIANALLILRNDPVLKGKLGYDVFAEKPKLRGDVPWRPKGSVHTEGRGTLWIDLDEAGIRWYTQTRWKFRSENDLRNALEMVFHDNEFHPVRDYLNSLTWDGVERLDTVFIRHLGAEDNAYVRQATRKWMCGAVARVMRPGCKFDQALVLNSKQQGLGKSTFVRMISNGWSNDSAVNMNDKEGYGVLHGSWIIELAELSSTKRSDVETVKTFISKCEDTYRPPYGKHVQNFPRQCVFYGTTNETEYLKDRTGNRRFWTIDVEQVMDFDAIEAERDQLWAEAVVRWKAGERLWLTDPDVVAIWQSDLAAHTVQDELEGQLIEYLDTPLPDGWDNMGPDLKRDWIQGLIPGAGRGTVPRMQVSLCEIRHEMMGENRRDKGGNDLTSRRIANIINNLTGWRKLKKRQRVPGYGPQFIYLRTQADLRRWRQEQKEQAEAFDPLS
jgi:predicted P-loop ATPase